MSRTVVLVLLAFLLSSTPASAEHHQRSSVVFADNFDADNVPLGSFSGCTQNGSVLTSQCAGLPGAVDAKWWAYPDGWVGTPGTSINAPSQTISIQNGVMDLYLHSHLIAAPIPKDLSASGPWGGRVYGRYRVRMRLDPVAGYHVSFLLWPDSNVWPRDGEIDWPEADLDQSIVGAFMHWQNATDGNQKDSYFSNTAMSSGWHTYETDWSTSAVRFLIDGVLVGQTTDRSHIPNTPMHWVLQTGQSFTEPLSDAAAGHVQIDWVEVAGPAG
jgi:hypothetical protein